MEATRVIIEQLPPDAWRPWGVGVQIVAAVLTLAAAAAAWLAARAAAKSAAAAERSAVAEEGQHRQDQASALGRLRDEWNGLRDVRLALCKRRVKTDNWDGELKQQVFGFFEWLGIAVTSGLVDAEASWHVFYEAVFHYHRVLLEEMRASGKRDPVLWCKFRDLEDTYQAVNLSLRKKRFQVEDEDHEHFLKAEAGLRDVLLVPPPGHPGKVICVSAEEWAEWQKMRDDHTHPDGLE